jgi:hypothetical protein
MKQERMMFEPTWTDIAYHMKPSMGMLPWNGVRNGSFQGPQDNNALLFDSTAARASDTFATGQCNYLTPPGQAWFTFDPPQQLQESDPVKH